MLFMIGFVKLFYGRFNEEDALQRVRGIFFLKKDSFYSFIVCIMGLKPSPLSKPYTFKFDR